MLKEAGMIIERLKLYFTKKRETQKQSLYIEGFNYALGALVRHEKTPIELDSEQYLDYKGSFDTGINDAINEAIKLKIVMDDRIW